MSIDEPENEIEDFKCLERKKIGEIEIFRLPSKFSLFESTLMRFAGVFGGMQEVILIIDADGSSWIALNCDKTRLNLLMAGYFQPPYAMGRLMEPQGIRAIFLKYLLRAKLLDDFDRFKKDFREWYSSMNPNAELTSEEDSILLADIDKYFNKL